MQQTSNYIVYWLDDHADPLEHHRIERKYLRAVLDFLRIVPSLDQVIDNDADLIYLIMNSRELSTRLVSFQSLSQLFQVYIYKETDAIDAFQLDQGHFKIKGVFNTCNELFRELTKEVRQKTALYQKDISILQSIDEFERDYKPEDAVRWYTREGFLYKVLNQALREQNSQTLRLLHFFVYDLSRRLTSALKNKEDPYQMWTSMDSQLYRGQLISRDECALLKRSEGEIMFTNSFLSMTMDHDVAVMFSGAGAYALESPLQPVLFHLDCSAWRPTQDVANVQELSFNADETEILFSPTHNMTLIKFDYDEALHVWKAYFIQDFESTKGDVHRGFYVDQHQTSMLMIRVNAPLPSRRRYLLKGYNC